MRIIPKHELRTDTGRVLRAVETGERLRIGRWVPCLLGCFWIQVDGYTVVAYGALPIENLLEVDPVGDAVHAGLHLFCHFANGENGSFASQQFMAQTGRYALDYPIALDLDLRTASYAGLQKERLADDQSDGRSEL